MLPEERDKEPRVDVQMSLFDGTSAETAETGEEYGFLGIAVALSDTGNPLSGSGRELWQRRCGGCFLRAAPALM